MGGRRYFGKEFPCPPRKDEVSGVELKKLEQELRQPQLIHEKAPKKLDLVKIDGRWTQVMEPGREGAKVLFLSTGRVEDVDYKKYRGRRYNVMSEGGYHDEKTPENPSKPNISPRFKHEFEGKKTEYSRIIHNYPDISRDCGEEENNIARGVMPVWGELKTMRSWNPPKIFKRG